MNQYKINKTQASGLTANNLSSPVTFTVEGVGFNTGINESYTLKSAYRLK
jgi:hypothetical protein